MKPLKGARYKSLYKLTPAGVTRYRSVMSGSLPDSSLDPVSEEFAVPIPSTKPFRVRRFQTSKEMAQSVIAAFEDGYSPCMNDWSSMWNWLSFVLRDQIIPFDGKGVRKKLDEPRWFAGGIKEHPKAYRNAVRMSVLLYHSFGNDVDHLLCSKPNSHPDIREQFTSWSDMMLSVLQKVGKKLYFDRASGKLKKSTGRGSGSPRRFVVVLRQLDITYDLSDVGYEKMLKMLPREFDRFLNSDA